MRFVLKLFGILLIFAFAVLYWKYRLPYTQRPIQQKPSPTPESKPLENSLEWNDRTYIYDYFTVEFGEKLELIPNFTEKMTSSDIADTHTCTKGINGGFYDTNSMPLGGFKSVDGVLKKPVSNRLIDGYIWNKGANRAITLSEPPDDAQWYLQAGPLLMLNGKTTAISIGNDEYRRRMIAGLTKDKRLLFLTVYNSESVYEGPLLADLPALLSLLNRNAGLNITDALNLDGGSASAFVSKDKVLQEFSPIGSFFCVK